MLINRHRAEEEINMTLTKKSLREHIQKTLDELKSRKLTSNYEGVPENMYSYWVGYLSSELETVLESIKEDE